MHQSALRMGTIFSRTMEENLKKNQEFITEMNKIAVCILSSSIYIAL
jgi:hypothetical protein